LKRRSRTTAAAATSSPPRRLRIQPRRGGPVGSPVDECGGLQQHDWGVTIRDKVGLAVWTSYFQIQHCTQPMDRVVSLFNWKARNDRSLKPKTGLLGKIGLPVDGLGEVRRRFAEFVLGTGRRTIASTSSMMSSASTSSSRYESLADDTLAFAAGSACRRSSSRD